MRYAPAHPTALVSMRSNGDLIIDALEAQGASAVDIAQLRLLDALGHHDAAMYSLRGADDIVDYKDAARTLVDAAEELLAALKAAQ